MSLSNDRAAERPPFLSASPRRRLDRLQYLYATFRQALLDYLTQRPTGTVLMPDFVPQGVHDPYLRAGWRILFYSVDLTLALDGEALARAIAAERPDHVVAIHYFGVYREENLRVLRAVLPERTTLLEDFGHTLPQEDVPVTGQLAAWSFTKLLGVAEGGLLWFGDRSALVPCRYGPDTPPARELRGRLERRLALESFLARGGTPALAGSIARRLLRGRTDYYDFLQARYPEIRAPIGRRSRELLERVDFARVAERRRAIARLYVEALDRRLRLPVPESALLRQTLYAFPVQVDDRGAFLRHLRRSGVRGGALVDHWWFQTERPPHPLRDRHCLLPANHHLTDAEVRRIVAAANAFAGGR